MPITAQSFEQVLNAHEDALFNEGATLSDFNQGSRLRVLMRANARVLSEVWRALSELSRDSNVATAQGIALELLTNTFGVSRKQGGNARGALIVSPLAPASTAIVNHGDLLTFDGATFEVYLPETLSLALAYPYAIVPVRAVSPGARWNLPPGSPLLFSRSDLQTAFTAVVGTAVDTRGFPVGALTGGENRETDAQLRIRFANHMNSLTRGTYLAVTTALSDISGLHAINVVERVPAVGWLSIFVDDGSANPLLDPAKVAEIEAMLFKWRAAGIGTRILTQEKVIEDIEVRVKVARDRTPADMETFVKEALVAQLGEFALGQVLYPDKLIDIAHSVPGVLSCEVIKPTAPVSVLPYQVFRPKSVVANAIL